MKLVAVTIWSRFLREAIHFPIQVSLSSNWKSRVRQPHNCASSPVDLILHPNLSPQQQQHWSFLTSHQHGTEIAAARMRRGRIESLESREAKKLRFRLENKVWGKCQFDGGLTSGRLLVAEICAWKLHDEYRAIFNLKVLHIQTKSGRRNHWHEVGPKGCSISKQRLWSYFEVWKIVARFLFEIARNWAPSIPISVHCIKLDCLPADPVNEPIVASCSENNLQIQPLYENTLLRALLVPYHCLPVHTVLEITLTNKLVGVVRTPTKYYRNIRTMENVKKISHLTSCACETVALSNNFESQTTIGDDVVLCYYCIGPKLKALIGISEFLKNLRFVVVIWPVTICIEASFS